MYISQTLERQVKFANFCREYNLSPQRVAEAIQASRDVNAARNKHYSKHMMAENEARKLITGLGFHDVTFEYGKMPTFLDESDDRIRFPDV